MSIKMELSDKILSLRKNEVDVFSEFEENAVINIEILRHSIYQCLYSTEDNDTFQNFISELKEDRIATIHFKKSMIFEKYFSVCSNHHILLVSISSKDQINKVLAQLQNCEIYCIDEKDRDRLNKYENSKLLQSYASDEQLKELRENLQDRINKRFEVFNAVQSVMVCNRTTYMTFMYLIEEVVSLYYDLTPQPIDFPSESDLSSNGAKVNVPTVIPFYYAEKANKSGTEENMQAEESIKSPPYPFKEIGFQINKSPVFTRSIDDHDEIKNDHKDNNKPLSLRKNEIDVFSRFEENTIISIEILRHSIYQCLYSTKDDDTFQNFILKLKEDRIATIHFKKSMIFEKYFSVCSNHHILLVSISSKDQINKVLAQLQNCEIYCIDEKDRDRLNKYENSKLLQSFAPIEKLEELRQTLHARINERFEVFNAVQSVMVCYNTTYMTYFYLTEEVISSYYDLTPQPLDFPSDSDSSSNETNGNTPTLIPFYYENKAKLTTMPQSESQSNPNLYQNEPLHRVPSLPRKEIDIFSDFKENEITDIEILPHSTFRCLYSTENDSTFHKFVSEIKDDPITTIHFKKSMIYEKYLSICSDYHALLIPYESKDQINEALSQIQNSKVFCIAEKDRDKLTNFENHKLIKSFATNDDLEILRETLHARINERFEVFNTAQSVMICYRTTYMTFFYLTEEVISTFYDLKTKSHKFLKTESKPNISFQSAPINEEDLPKFNELYNSLEDKIKLLHTHINGNESYMGIDSTLIDANDYLQLSSNHQVKKGLSDCIKTYEKANAIMKEAEEKISNFINSSPSQGSLLPSLNRSVQYNSNDSQGSDDNYKVNEDKELKNLKYEVESLQNKLNRMEQQIRLPKSNDLSPTKSYNNSPRTNHPREPLLQPTTPPSPRKTTSSSPRTMRNRLISMQRKVDEGDVMAMYSLGACYALGDGVPQDKEKALQYYTLAAEKGNKNAQYAAAACHSYGKGTTVDKNKAFELYLSAALQGHPKAQFAVAHFYEYGQGGAGRNHEKAKEWYRKAAEQGHAAAKKFLDNCLSETPMLDVED